MLWLEQHAITAEGRIIWHPDNHSRTSDFVVPVAAVVPAASDFVVPLPPAPAGGAAAMTRGRTVALFMADGRDELSTQQRLALDSTFTDSDTGSASASSTGSASSTYTIDTSSLPDRALRHRGGMRGSTSSSHLAILSFFTFVTPADAASPAAIFDHLVQSHRVLFLSFLMATLLLVLNNIARNVRRSTTASASACVAPTPCPVRAIAA
jgi:hypothetical protein